jgi:hypothetical protein
MTKLGGRGGNYVPADLFGGVAPTALEACNLNLGAKSNAK